VVLKNPLSASQEVMRTSLLPGLLSTVAAAGRHGERSNRLFTVGRLFLGAHAADLPREPLAFAAVLTGERPGYLAPRELVDVWDGKGVAEGFVRRLTGRATEVHLFASDARPRHLHPRGAARVSVSGFPVGSLGPLHPDVCERFELKDRCIVVELDLEAIGRLGRHFPRFAPVPRFPASTRDLALVVSDEVAAGEVESAVRTAAGDLAEAVLLFDRFTGAPVPPDHSSLGFRIVYRAEGRTVTDAEVDAQHAKVVREVGSRFGATLRV
jgi:phenylalanyl-tRNA synthetase beta chain